MSVDVSVLAVIETLYGFLDRSTAAIVLLDGHKRVVFANERAGRLHDRADGIRLSPSGLTLLRAHDNAKLQALIARAVASNGTSSLSMRAPRAAGSRPYGVIVAPLAKKDSMHSGVQPAACIVIADPERPKNLALERLQEAFDLTDAESRLAARLADGEGLKSAAASLGITYGTARVRLADIFQKTETRRQGELVSLLLNTLAAI